MSIDEYKLLSKGISDTCVYQWSKSLLIDEVADWGLEKFEHCWKLRSEIVAKLGCNLDLLSRFMEEIKLRRTFEDQFQCTLPHFLLSRKEIYGLDSKSDESTPNSIDWQGLAKRYPNSFGTVGLISACWPMIDTQAGESLLHISLETGVRVGGGGFVFYKVTESGFVKAASYPTWAHG